MALVEIENVNVAAAQPDYFRGFSIDCPAAGATSDVYDIEISGWVIGATQPVVAIEVHIAGSRIRRVSLDQLRPDLAAAHPGIAGADTAGFRTWVSTIGLPPNTPLQVRAVFDDGSRRRLGAIGLTHQPLRSDFTPGLHPLMLTTIGRAGTTWTMRLLSEHPRIAVHRWHPYELRTARYWLHMVKVLSEPRDPEQSGHADRFQNERSWVGHNPFYPEPVSTVPGLRQWFGRTYVENLAAFGQSNIEACYRLIASAQGQDNPLYFAEKHRPDNLPWLVWELYPKVKELFLVRDFRDVISSMLAFNVKQGRRAFGPEHITNDEEFARFMRGGTVGRLATSWSRRQDRAHLIRYEDLVRDPLTTLRGILGYLELEDDEPTMRGMIERATEENPEMRRHLTSSDVSASMGRWRQSLTPEVQAVSNEVFADVLEQFGYPVESNTEPARR